MFTIDGARQRIKTAFHRERFAGALHSAGRPGTERTNPYASYTPDRFIRDLDFALTRLADPADIVAVTVRMLGEYTEADRCDYAAVETDQDHFVILGDYARDGTNSLTRPISAIRLR